MRRKIILCVVLTVAVAGFSAFRLASTFRLKEGLAGQAPHPDSAILVLDRDLWDFGVVRPGTTFVTHFTLRNVGRRRLIARQQSSSCECVAADQNTIILQPGQSTEITATLDTQNLRGGYQMELHFTTSAPNLPKFKLTLLADVDGVQSPDQASQLIRF